MEKINNFDATLPLKLKFYKIFKVAF